ncbi:hypothetical protein LPJ57_000723 [Coemansia sp. RSA 486]|nr:hypothetical protein LPJ57_000723 [Coemansia sp. RSA 486]KAJ2235753.1 hypothetical protein IWW45_002352 [Coemansia sp. RSA 485]
MADAYSQSLLDPLVVASRRQEFWKTVLAMGFDPKEACTGSYSGVRLDAQVFETCIFHTKAAELLLYFLFKQLDSTRLHRDFFDCWPIGDPRQARDFRAHAFKWLDEIRRESVEAHDGRWPSEVPVRRSFVDESRGLRFESILWTLARITAVSLLEGPWKQHIKRALGNADARAIRACRERYARRTRDRLLAQKQWEKTRSELTGMAEQSRRKRELVYDAYRASRRQITRIAHAPPVDASPDEVAGALGTLAAEAAKLWEGSFGWIQKNSELVETVDAIMERRANATRLDGRKHVRLVPPPQMSAQWTRWMDAERVQPFKGASVDLQAVARMAATCVGALRGALASQSDTNLSLRSGGDGSQTPAALPQISVDLPSIEAAVAQQEARIERLRRLRSHLAEQREHVSRVLRANLGDLPSQKDDLDLLAEAAIQPVPESKRVFTSCNGQAEPMRLALMWDDLLEADGEHMDELRRKMAGTAYPPLSSSGIAPGLARLSLARASDPLTPSRSPLLDSLTVPRKRQHASLAQSSAAERGAKRRSITRELSDMLIDDGAPDFLVG